MKFTNSKVFLAAILCSVLGHAESTFYPKTGHVLHNTTKSYNMVKIPQRPCLYNLNCAGVLLQRNTAFIASVVEREEKENFIANPSAQNNFKDNSSPLFSGIHNRMEDTTIETKSKMPQIRRKRQIEVERTNNTTTDTIVQNTTLSSLDAELALKIARRLALLAEKARTKPILSVLQVVSLTFSVLSIITVILAVGVFLHKRMANRVTLLITAFNLTEGFKAVLFTIHRSWRFVLGDSIITWASVYANYFTFVVGVIPDALGRISLLLNLIITLDRFVILAFPLKSLNRKVVVHPKLTVACVIVSMLGFQMSNIAMFATEVAGRVNYTRQFRTHEVLAEMSVVDAEAVALYRTLQMVAAIAFRYIPLILTIVLSVVTIVFLVYNNPFKGRGNGDSQSTNNVVYTTTQARKRQNNLMIVTSALIYSFMVSMKPLLRVISSLHPTFGEGKRDLYLFSVFFEAALLLDNTSPVVIFLSYCKLSSVFRSVLAGFFRQAVDLTSSNGISTGTLSA